MVFSSAAFLFAFLPLILAGYFVLPKKARNLFLTAMSLGFYAWGEPKFVLVMVASIGMNYVFGLLAAKYDGTKIQGRVLTVMVIMNLGLLFVFKYLNFTIDNINHLFGNLLPPTHITLPIGISFFTFQAMSYVFDVALGRGQVQRNPLNVTLYVALFPQLIAGPIVRYETVAREIGCRQETLEEFVIGTRRFTMGLAKKMLLSNSIALLADQAFDCPDPAALSASLAWLGALAYAFQIYFDFSGYSDMAIGLGLMFGFHFDENFNYPYISRTVSEFWNRWHISLSSWFRDYLFYPVSRRAVPLGKRVKKKWGKAAGRLTPTVIALAVVWLSTGIWHGASWGYILWGVYYGVLLIAGVICGPAIKRFCLKRHIPTESRGFHLFQICRTMVLVLMGYVLFRSTSLSRAGAYFGAMLGLTGNAAGDAAALTALKNHGSALILCALFSAPVVPYLEKKLHPGEWVKTALTMALLLLSGAYIVSSSYNPFIYFAF